MTTRGESTMTPEIERARVESYTNSHYEIAQEIFQRLKAIRKYVTSTGCDFSAEELMGMAEYIFTRQDFDPDAFMVREKERRLVRDHAVSMARPGGAS